ncbi:MAG TPA: peptidoglycan glycosyltransferase [Phaeodactylibacter sp.]|nr:peptidoglycan glycosyltransferase [Phaeodactylibacter sp.]
MQEQSKTVKEIREGRAPLYKKLVKWLWALSILGILSVAGIFIALSFSDLPSFEELENPKDNLASEVYASNGEVLGRYFIENRVPVDFDQISDHVTDAFIATEDERYLNHSGIDFYGLGRAGVKTFLLGNKSSGGASTITQQLAKMLFTEKPASGLERVMQKLKEWIIAVRLEKKYTKQEIIAMYLNKFSYLNGAYGIKAASEIYFGKSQKDLETQEAAMLVGMLKNPSLFNPIRRPDATLHRRMIVLKQMQKNNLLTQSEYDSLRALPLGMGHFNRKTHDDGLAPYFRMHLREELKRILADESRAKYKPNGEPYNLYEDGLKIYTTIDPIIQAHAEAAMRKHMKKQQKKFWKRWKGKDPWTYRDPADDREPDEIEEDLKTRKRALKKLIRGTNRYQSLRKKELDEILTKISKTIDGYILRDFDIDRMMSESKKKGVIAKLVSRKIVPSSRAVKYRKIMNGADWKRLKTRWSIFQNKVRKEFDQPVEMVVFDYTPTMEKDTIMSPLDSIRYHRMFLQFGSMSVNPLTGHVKSWIGGINHKYFQYDHVTSARQVGSTFKPFIYATAIDQQGMSPCYPVYDIPYTIHVGEGDFNLNKDWTPKNAGGRYSGEAFTLIRGLQWSKNTVSVYLMKQLGSTELVRELVNNMGLDKNKKRPDGLYRIPKVPSICLGSLELSVFEMTGAYTTFANNGLYNKPIFITKIVDKNGKEIYRETALEQQALDARANYVMMYMLKQVMNQGQPNFRGLKSEIGGKTGTTNDYVDGWFMGLTPDLVVGTWVGGEDRWIRFLQLRDGAGSKMARPFFADLLHRLEADDKVDYDKTARFYVPKGDLGIELDCGKYEKDKDPLAPENEDESFGDQTPQEDEGFGDEEEEDENF